MPDSDYEDEFQNRAREVKINIRVPQGLRWRIQRKARANGVSMNKEIWQCLEESYPTPVFDVAGLLDLLEYVDEAETEEDFHSRIDECNEMLARAKATFRAKPGEGKSVIIEYSTAD